MIDIVSNRRCGFLAEEEEEDAVLVVCSTKMGPECRSLSEICKKSNQSAVEPSEFVVVVEEEEVEEADVVVCCETSKRC